jgi:hypothetical protein
MVRKLAIRELIRVFDFRVAEHELHPPFGERRLLCAQRRDKPFQFAGRCVTHGRFRSLWRRWRLCPFVDFRAVRAAADCNCR